MSSLKNDFNELIERIKIGRDRDHASFEPVYYLVFSPDKILELKRQMPAFTARLNNEGWEVETFSIAENILEIFETAKLRNIWLKADSNNPLDWKKTNDSLANYLIKSKELQNRMESKINSLAEKKNAILLVTDLEGLHPYMRIGIIESQLQGKFVVPTVFFYPGIRTGKSNLKFLGFYPEDGNYRSVHVGG